MFYLYLGTTPGTSVDGAFPPWNLNACTLLTSSSPMSSANLKPWNFNDFKAFLLQYSKMYPVNRTVRF